MAEACQYHAVALPESYTADDAPAPNDRVFVDKDRALELIRQIKKSRLRSFERHDEALAFAATRISEAELSAASKSQASDAERQSIGPYKSLAPRDLAKLRLTIERKACPEFEELIRSNPRYLISSADTAVVLMEGPRYNAAHVAAKADKPDMLRILLSTITDRNYIRLLYPADSEETLDNRVQVLLDCYLNTPDKAACETPLHFASKFGSRLCVQLLLSYSLCDTNKVNTQQKRAVDIICDRKGDAALKAEIAQLFANQYYVPVIRTDDDDRAIVSPPCKRDAFTPTKHTKAVAGPTSPELAQQLYTYLKSPARRGQRNSIRLTDPSKGLERDASSKCQEIGVKWAEYWEFLEDSVDLASDQGLHRLEKHFRKVYAEMLESERKATEGDPNKRPSPMSGILLKMETLSLSTVEAENDDTKAASNSAFVENTAATNTSIIGMDDDSDESFYTPPSSPAFELEFFVYGPFPTRCDRQAFNALRNVDIAAVGHHVYVSNWLKRMPLLDLNFSLSAACTPQKLKPPSIHQL